MGEINELHNYTLIIMPTSRSFIGYTVLMFKLLSCQNVYYLPVPINLCLQYQTIHPQETANKPIRSRLAKSQIICGKSSKAVFINIV
jgi:hypothetical protein